jgi:hypothetical protein
MHLCETPEPQCTFVQPLDPLTIASWYVKHPLLHLHHQPLLLAEHSPPTSSSTAYTQIKALSGREAALKLWSNCLASV